MGPDVGVSSLDVGNGGVPAGGKSLLISWGHLFKLDSASSSLEALISDRSVVLVSSLHDPGVQAESSSVLVASSGNGQRIDHLDFEINIRFPGLSEADVLLSVPNSGGVDEVLEILLVVDLAGSLVSLSPLLKSIDSTFKLGLIDADVWQVKKHGVILCQVG